MYETGNSEAQSRKRWRVAPVAAGLLGVAVLCQPDSARALPALEGGFHGGGFGGYGHGGYGYGHGYYGYDHPYGWGFVGSFPAYGYYSYSQPSTGGSGIIARLRQAIILMYHSATPPGRRFQQPARCRRASSLAVAPPPPGASSLAVAPPPVGAMAAGVMAAGPAVTAAVSTAADLACDLLRLPSAAAGRDRSPQYHV